MSEKDIHADSVRAEREKQARAEFMRAYVVSAMRGACRETYSMDQYLLVKQARRAWDSIEEEASR